MKQTFAAVAAMFILASCHVNYDKTNSGLVYKIFPGKGGDSLKPGKFVKFNVEFSLPEKKDSILNTTFGKIPGYDKVDTSKSTEYTFMEILPRMQVGDSAEVIMSIDSLKNRKALPDYNETFVKGGHINCKIKILGIFNEENDIMADYEKEGELEKQREIKSIEDYLTSKGLKDKAIKTKGGAYVVIDTPGDETMKADSGTTASLMYKGYLQTTGIVFDTNMDTSKGHAGVFDVQVGVHDGVHDVIQGWNEALPYFGKGSKGKIYVPGMLAYGARPPGPQIPAYANLVFEIELQDVKPTPPPAPLTDQQKMQMMMQQQQQQQQQQGGQ